MTAKSQHKFFKSLPCRVSLVIRTTAYQAYLFIAKIFILQPVYTIMLVSVFDKQLTLWQLGKNKFIERRPCYSSLVSTADDMMDL
jgi:hypothetical protein